jgi:formylglycine-generating enzyme required for sulfatase activity
MLLPNFYLVVAYLDDGRFHEVYRRVPENVSDMSESSNHARWSSPEPGVILLNPIKIPEASINAGMARFAGSDDFVVGAPGNPEIPEHRRRVPPFYLDTREVSVEEWKATPRTIRPEIAKLGILDGDAMPFVDWDRAVAYAETVGKRLPDEIEYEFAATSGGRRKFPWGDDAARITEWKFGPVGEPEYDRLDTDPPVTGLFSNVAEWTSTWANHYPSEKSDPLRALVKLDSPTLLAINSTDRIVRGGPPSVITGSPDLPQALEGPRARASLGLHLVRRGLGFRCARSTRPRLHPENFGRVVP